MKKYIINKLENMDDKSLLKNAFIVYSNLKNGTIKKIVKDNLIDNPSCIIKDERFLEITLLVAFGLIVASLLLFTINNSLIFQAAFGSIGTFIVSLIPSFVLVSSSLFVACLMLLKTEYNFEDWS